MDVTFQCSKCGACCKRAGLVGLMPDRGDGACFYLQEDNTCGIYETRPEICRVDAMFDKRKAETPELMEGIDKKSYFKLNSMACNLMMDEDEIPDEFRIDLTKYEIF